MNPAFGRPERAPTIDLTGDDENENQIPAQRFPNPMLAEKRNVVPSGENRYNPYRRTHMRVELSPLWYVPPKPLKENQWPAEYNQVTTAGWDQHFGMNQTLGMEHHFRMNANFGMHPMASPHFTAPSWTSPFQPLPAFCQYQINKMQGMSPSYYSAGNFNQLLYQQEQERQRQLQQQEQERMYQKQRQRQQEFDQELQLHQQQQYQQQQLQLQQQQHQQLLQQQQQQPEFPYEQLTVPPLPPPVFW